MTLISDIRKYMMTLLVAVLCVSALGGENTASRSESAAFKRVSSEIEFLASDAMEGRGPGTEGIEKAAEYIRDQFRELGLASGTPDGTYFQPFPLSLGKQLTPAGAHLVLEHSGGAKIELRLGKDFQALTIGGDADVSGELVFAGYGISAPKIPYDDFEGVDVEGKIVVLFRREPQQDDDKSPFDGKRVSAHSYIRTKMLRAAERKAAAILLVNDPYSTEKAGEDVLAPINGFGGASRKIPIAHIRQSVLDRILATSPLKTSEGETLRDCRAVSAYIDKHLRPVSAPLAGWKGSYQAAFADKKTTVKNVVAVLEGKGPLADQTIIIGAHYDHLGYGGFGSRRPGVYAVHNGADDNATGTSAMLELARRFASLPEPLPRRIVFIAFSAEERGLIGSKYYVEHPLFPLENTTAMINFDMIGNVRDERLLVYGTGTAKAFGPLIEPAAEGTGLTIDAKAGVLAASDHWPFFRKKVPSFHIFSGMTAIYHTPDDDFETINVEGVVQAIDFTEKLATAIARLPEQTQFVETARQRMPRPRRGVGNYGFMPDYAAKVEGVRVSAVKADSVAAKGGLRQGDIIVAVGGTTVGRPPELIRALRSVDRSKPLKLAVKRGDQTVQLELAPLASAKPEQSDKQKGPKGTADAVKKAKDA